MRPYQQLASLVFAALGIYLVLQGIDLKIEGDFGPGPGFMASVVGALLVIVSLGWGLQVTLSPSTAFSSEALPDRIGLLRVVATSAALVVLGFALTTIGFRITLLAFLLFTLFIFGRDHTAMKIVVASAFSFGLAWIFEHVLHVPLPSASFETLSNLGL